MKKFLHQFGSLLILYWRDASSRMDAVKGIVVLALTILNVYLNVLFNEWKNAFYTALQNYNYEEVIHQMYWFVELAACAIIISMYSFYLQRIIGLNWRKYLTRVFLGKWLSGNKYYLMNLVEDRSDNPDQRIGEDIRLFVDKTLTFCVGILNALLTLILFVNILWTLSGVIPVDIGEYHLQLHGYIVFIAIAYSILGTGFTHLVGKRLTRLNYIQQRLEADFRHAMMRMGEYAESISLYKGSTCEKVSLLRQLDLLLGNFKKIIFKERHVIAFKSGYFQMASIIPVLVAVPLYMKNTINLGGLMQGASAFTRVTGSLSYFVLLYTEFAEWRSVVARLSNFNLHMQTLRNNFPLDEQKYTVGRDDTIEINNLALYKPDLISLFCVSHMELHAGTHVFITGENAVGKSTLLKALAGIWPYYSGVISCPGPDKMIFLSQKPYMPFGTLEDCIRYPLQNGIDQEQMMKFLDYFGLGYLRDKLDKEADWQSILSLGEQQKISIIRACLASPKWLVLDEAVANMDMKSIQTVYEYLTKETTSTLITVGHGKELEKYHNLKLVIDDGKCRCENI